MLNAFALSLAITTATANSGQITIIDDRPSIRIHLGAYDLSQPHDLAEIQQEIWHAAGRVCDVDLRDAIYIERAACVQAAARNGADDLHRVLDQRSAAGLAASIIVSAPAN